MLVWNPGIRWYTSLLPIPAHLYELPLVDEQDAIANHFAIKNNKDLEDILDALETYCFNTDSDNLPQVFKLRSTFNNEKIQAAAAQQRRLKQGTLDVFVIVE